MKITPLSHCPTSLRAGTVGQCLLKAPKTHLGQSAGHPWDSGTVPACAVAVAITVAGWPDPLNRLTYGAGPAARMAFGCIRPASCLGSTARRGTPRASDDNPRSQRPPNGGAAKEKLT